MTSLSPGFEPSLKRAVLDDAEAKAVEIGRELRAVAQAKFIAYAARHGYSIEHIWQDVRGPFVDRSDNAIHIRLEWPGLTALFEWGVPPHTIEGNPLLHFIWEDAPQGARETWPGDPPEVFIGSVEHPGLPPANAIQEAFDEVAP